MVRVGLGTNRLRECIDGERTDGFWDEVVENLRHGRIRPAFLVDRVPHELRRIVEWLNEQTIDTEVLAVEVMQYGTAEHRVLVPRLIGATAAAAAVKKSATRGPGFEVLLGEASPESKELGERLAAWALRHDILTRRTAKGLRYLADDGHGLCTFYPHWDGLEMRVAVHRGSHPDEAEEYHRALESFTGSPLSSQSPIVYCDKLLADWSTFEDQILTRFARAFGDTD